MTVLIPQDDHPLGESFASMLSNEISGVQFVNDKVWLVVSPTGDITSWLIPLLCPVCGGAWHFSAENIHETVAYLREKLVGFVLAGMHYHTQVTEQSVRAMQTWLYSDSDIFAPLVITIPEHAGMSAFPAVALILEKRVPLEMDLVALKRIFAHALKSCQKRILKKPCLNCASCRKTHTMWKMT